jgi:predicted nucleic acid-binding protein
MPRQRPCADGWLTSPFELMYVWLPLPQMRNWRTLTWEREAIQLAEEQHADLLLIDERKGRRQAKQRGLKTTGTLGVLFSSDTSTVAMLQGVAFSTLRRYVRGVIERLFIKGGSHE